MKNILVCGKSDRVLNQIEELLIQEGMGIVREEVLRESKMENREIQLLLFHMEAGKPEEIELIKTVRAKSSVPVLVMSENAGETIKIAALNAGADDYVSLDCSPLEVLARIKSQLRRYLQLAHMCENISRIYRIDELEIDDIQKKVTVAGQEVRMTPLEYKILTLLVSQKGKVLSIEQIYETIWKMKAVDADNIIAVHIRHIREKIEQNPKNPKYLKAVWGTGYKVG